MEMGKMTWPQVDEYLRRHESPMVLIPISPVEEHGPHLPLGTDYLLAKKAALMVAKECQALVYETIPLMCCGISRDSPGTYPIEGETLKGIVRDLVKGCAQKGFRRIFFLSTHWGYSIEMIREAIQEVLPELPQGCKAEVIPFKEVAKIPPGLLETTNDTHAGEIETSLMLALYPELVGELPPADFHQMKDGKPGVLSQSGVNGDPQKATREKGEVIARAAIEGVIARINSLIER
jgi:creatinine amidohydrolase